jgi:hypothetical protein
LLPPLQCCCQFERMAILHPVQDQYNIAHRLRTYNPKQQLPATVFTAVIRRRGAKLLSQAACLTAAQPLNHALARSYSIFARSVA